ncbi:MAG: type IV toxin-antitoxin system AbiEi family antitoxin domain-containing protein [Actinomycetota bacterium]|nr:type IV toxin-antitoxin system AbiEi family antitoxin domain-containing protein [Actinomycetota bacterium]
MNKGKASDQKLARIAARQHGLFSRAQALAAGFTDAVIQRRLRDGFWIRVGSGVYCVAGAPLTWKQRALAACLVAGPGAVVSHRSAAVLHQVAGFRPGPLEITVPTGRSSRSSLATVHRSGLLLPRDRTLVDGIPVTHPARMLLELANRVSRPTLEDAVDDVLCRRLTSLDRLMAAVDQPSTGHHGVHNLRGVLEAWAGGNNQPMLSEMRLIRELVARGLPRPVCQFEIRIDGHVYRIDIAWPPVKGRSRARQLPLARGEAPIPRRPSARQPHRRRGVAAAPSDPRRRPRQPRAC